MAQQTKGLATTFLTLQPEFNLLNPWKKGRELTSQSGSLASTHMHAQTHTSYACKHTRAHTHTNNSTKRCRQFKQNLIYQGEAKQTFQREIGVGFCFVDYKEVL